MPGIAGGWPGRGGAAGGVGITCACCIAWFNRIVCPALGFVICEVLPVSTRVLPSDERNTRVTSCCGAAPAVAGCTVCKYSAVEGGKAGGEKCGVTAIPD